MATNEATDDTVTRIEELLGSLDLADGFRTAVTVPVSLTDPDQGTEQKFYFILKSVEFVFLQSYVRTGLLLPTSKEAFEDTYPRKVLEKYVDELLYNVSKIQVRCNKPKLTCQRMRDVLVDIQNHCHELHSKTLNHIILLGE